MMKIFVLILLILSSCGSRNDQFVEFEDDILDALRRRQVQICLTENFANIRSLRNSALGIMQGLSVGQFWNFAYSRDNNDADDEDTNRNVEVYVETISPDPNDPDIPLVQFIVVNENANDSNPSDQKRFTYTVKNFQDHVQLLAIQACESSENLNITDSRISFTRIGANETTTFLISDANPAFLGRFFSFVSQSRTGDTEDNLGSVSNTTTLTPTQQAIRDLPDISTDIMDTCTFTELDFTAIAINEDGTQTPNVTESSLSDEARQRAIILFPIDTGVDEATGSTSATILNTLRVQGLQGIVGC